MTNENTRKELTITRIFNAPRNLVWKAWTDAEQMKRWWGPEHFTAPFCKMDVRIGGKFLFCMRSPEGKDYWSTGVYREIVPMERIVCTDSFADEKGNVVSATHYGMNPDFPMEMLVTVTFEDYEGKTKMTVRHAGMPPSDQDGARQGWNGSFDKLAASLKMNPVIHFEMPAEDRKRMSNFYTRAFGWQTKQLGPDMGEYVLVTTTESDENGPKRPGAINGGFFQKTDDKLTQYPSVVISVDDIKESMKKVEEAGGKVVGEIMDIPGVGQYASFLDTEGNRVGMLQPAMSR